MEYAIQKITTTEEIATCIAMMLSTHPWNALYFTEEQLAADLANGEAIQVYAAVTPDAKKPLGFLASMAHGIGFEPMIEYLCVSESCRGKGIGTALIRFFEEVLFPDADNLYLFVSDINPSAIALYERLGYQRIGALPDFNLMEQTEFLYRKTRRPRQAAKAATRYQNKKAGL